MMVFRILFIRVILFFLVLFSFVPDIFGIQDSDDVDYLKNTFTESELGSAFNFDGTLRDQKLGLSLYASFVQNYILSGNLNSISFLTGGEFRYNCLKNVTSEICFLMLGPVFSFRQTNEIVSWIEHQLDFRGGFAYATVNSNLANISKQASGVLGYLSVNPGISFLFRRIGFRVSYFFDTFFFIDQIILSHAGSFSLFTRF